MFVIPGVISRKKRTNNAKPNNNIDLDWMINSSAFEYKNKITGNTYDVTAGAAGHDANRVGKKEIELAIPLKYLG